MRTSCEFPRVDVPLATATANDPAPLHDGAGLHLQDDLGAVGGDDELDNVARVCSAVDVMPALLHAELQLEKTIVGGGAGPVAKMKFSLCAFHFKAMLRLVCF